MPTTTTTNHHADGFAVPLTEATYLGTGFMLIVESADGAYQPVAAVSTIREAREIASRDRMARVEDLDRGGEPLCPERYVVWARGANGAYLTACEIDALDAN
jgi:hypothetical protein